MLTKPTWNRLYGDETDKAEQAHEDKIEARARELYEASRKRVSGRPTWEKLNPADAYDMGMRNKALELARAEMTA